MAGAEGGGDTEWRPNTRRDPSFGGGVDHYCSGHFFILIVAAIYLAVVMT